MERTTVFIFAHEYEIMDICTVEKQIEIPLEVANVEDASR